MPIMQAIMMSSNECSLLKSFKVNYFDLCKKGFFWCEFSNGSSIFQGEAIFEDAERVCEKKNAKFVKPNSTETMQKIFDHNDRIFARFWTPIKRVTSTTFRDHGVIKSINDSSTYFGLELYLNDGDAYDAKRWDNQQSSTAYEILNNDSNIPTMPFIDYMVTNETRVIFSVRNALIKPFFQNSKQVPNGFHGCLCTRTDRKLIHPGIATLVPPLVILTLLAFIYSFSVLYRHAKAS